MQLSMMVIRVHVYKPGFPKRGAFFCGGGVAFLYSKWVGVNYTKTYTGAHVLTMQEAIKAYP